MGHLAEWWKKSSKAFQYTMYAAAGSLIISGGLFTIAYRRDAGADFWDNIFQNLFAEFFGLSIGILVTAMIARYLANQKLKELAPEVIRLIAHLRDNETINGEAARSCVICAAKFLSEDNLESSREGRLNLEFKFDCPVCKLPAPTELLPGGVRSRRCKLCKLESGVWNIKLDRETATSAGEPRTAEPSKQ